MGNDVWEIMSEETEDHWLQVRDPDGWYMAVVKWDGCIQYAHYFNTPATSGYIGDGDSDTLHICDIDDEIARLQALKTLATQFFTERYGQWPA